MTLRRSCSSPSTVSNVIIEYQNSRMPEIECLRAEIHRLENVLNIIARKHKKATCVLGRCVDLIQLDSAPCKKVNRIKAGELKRKQQQEQIAFLHQELKKELALTQAARQQQKNKIIELNFLKDKENQRLQKIEVNLKKMYRSNRVDFITSSNPYFPFPKASQKKLTESVENVPPLHMIPSAKAPKAVITVDESKQMEEEDDLRVIQNERVKQKQIQYQIFWLCNAVSEQERFLMDKQEKYRTIVGRFYATPSKLFNESVIKDCVANGWRYKGIYKEHLRDEAAHFRIMQDIQRRRDTIVEEVQ